MSSHTHMYISTVLYCAQCYIKGPIIIYSCNSVICACLYVITWSYPGLILSNVYHESSPVTRAVIRDCPHCELHFKSNSVRTHSLWAALQTQRAAYSPQHRFRPGHFKWRQAQSFTTCIFITKYVFMRIYIYIYIYIIFWVWAIP